MKRHRTASRKPTNRRRRKAAMPKRRKTLKSTHRAAYSIVHLQEQLERQARELEEAREERTAIAEVLRIINSSPGEPGAVFQIILDNATRICGAKFGTVYLYDGDLFHFRAEVGSPPEYAEFQRQRGPFRPAPGTHMDRIIRTKQVSYTMDAAAEPVVGPVVKIGGARSFVGVPMLKDDVLIGVFGVYRQEVRPFTEKQIALLTNFSAQAVIAIENARLLNELRNRTADLAESLEQQTATSDVLRVISSSPGDLNAVFTAMLESATRICDANFANLELYENGAYRIGAMHNAPPALVEMRQREPVIRPGPSSALTRAMATKQAVHVLDYAEERTYKERNPGSVYIVELAKARTLLVVPMLKEDEPLGVIAIYRTEVRPFTDKQIELLSNFAAQAVIAIENTRLLSELRQRTADLAESLEQQTATSEVLRVISSSPGNLEAVFEAMLENATRICEANFGVLNLHENGALRPGAMHNVPSAFANWLKDQRHGYRPIPGSPLDHVLRTKQLSVTADHAVAVSPGRATTLGGARSTVCVPMIKDDELVGTITIYRQEVRPFTDKQIALLQNFADQAVIAIENARLLNELRESLEQQTATADVLRVISSSPGDLAPVFETILENATRICAAGFGNLLLYDEKGYRVTAMHGAPPAWAELRRRDPVLSLHPNSPIARAARTKQPQHVPDSMKEDAYLDGDRAFIDIVEIAGARTILAVPMLKDDKVLGTMVIYRQEVSPFTPKQVELVKNFAAQAVIAIENTRLLNELRQRTDDLSKSLNDLRTAQDRLVQTQKLASLGQLTAGIAHEIKNPLNFVNNFSGLSVELLDELQEAVASGTFDDKKRSEIAELTDTLRGNLDKIAQHGKRADSIVKNMLLHSREGSGKRRPVNVNALVEESLNLAYHGARAEKQGFTITLERSFDPEAGEADVFPQEITRVLLNLISNGFYAAVKRQGEADDKGHEPTLAAATKSLGDKVEIRIRDNGTGIPPEVKEKMFNPFFTTKPAGEGTGLGLSISHDIIVKQHSGAIEVDTEPGEFTEFRIILPRTSA